MRDNFLAGGAVAYYLQPRKSKFCLPKLKGASIIFYFYGVLLTCLVTPLLLLALKSISLETAMLAVVNPVAFRVQTVAFRVFAQDFSIPLSPFAQKRKAVLAFYLLVKFAHI